MAFDGSGAYAAPSSSFNPAVQNTDISPTDWIALLADLQTALSTAICKDGQTTITANIPMNSKKLTGLAAGTTSGDALSYGQAGASLSGPTLTGTATAATLNATTLTGGIVNSTSATAGAYTGGVAANMGMITGGGCFIACVTGTNGERAIAVIGYGAGGLITVSNLISQNATISNSSDTVKVTFTSNGTAYVWSITKLSAVA